MTTTLSPRFERSWKAECENPISDLAIAPNGRNVAAATEDGPMCLLDAVSGKRLWLTPGHPGGTTSLGWTPDGSWLVSGGRDGHAIVSASSDGAIAGKAACGAGWVERVAVAPHGRTFAVSCGREVTLRGLRAELLAVWPQLRSTVLDLTWRPSRGTPTLACVAYGAVSLFRESSLAPWRQLPWSGSSLTLAWSPDGRFIATGDQDATVHLWIVKRSEDLMMSGYARKVRELAWSCDSRYLATGGGAAVTVWDCTPPGPAGSAPIVLELHEAPVRSLAFRADGRLASGAADGSVVVWDVATAQPVASLGEGASATFVRWGVDGRALFVADADGVVTAWSEA